jgi:hypothetical protein
MNIQAGDIGFVTNKRWNSPFTKFFLQINRLRIGRPIKGKEIYAHVFTIAEKDGKKYVCESIHGGWTIAEYPGQYAGREDTIHWKEPQTLWTDQQKADFSQTCFDFQEKKKEYDVPGYLWQIIYTTVGWWFGATGKRALKKITCSEAIPTIVNIAFNQETFECYYLQNPFTLYIDSYYKRKITL